MSVSLKTDNELFNKLNVLNHIVSIINEFSSPDDFLQQICYVIPEAYKSGQTVSVRIIFNNKQFKNKGFKESSWLEISSFNIPGSTHGIVEIFYTKQYIEHISKEDALKNADFLKSISTIIMGAISRMRLEKLQYEHTERIKELKGINYTTEVLQKRATLEESLQEICFFLPEAWQFPEYAVARITFENQIFTSNNFKETSWQQSQRFKTPDKKNGSIEIFYLKEFPNADEGPFLKEERKLIDNLAALISGTASNKALQQLFYSNTERLKELRGINQTSTILKTYKKIEDALQEICTILPEAWQFPEYTAARIVYENKIFVSKNFKETKWFQQQNFEAPGNKKGVIEIFYFKEFPLADEGPFLKEERNLLINLSNLIAGSASKDVLNKLLYENKERLKELNAINQTSAIIAKGQSIDETLQEICSMLPNAWQYPHFTAAKIRYEEHTYSSKNFTETKWIQKENFVTIDNKKGSIEIYYLKEFPEIYEGPFMKEERQLIINLGKLISGYLNNYKGREIYNKSLVKTADTHKSEEYRQSLMKSKKPLQLFFNQQFLDKYIYLDMMKYKVKNILFVATLYDAFILENEDSFFEQFMGEIYQYSLFSLPRITGVSSPAEALELLSTTRFDLVLLMVGMDSEIPIELSKRIKAKEPNLPVYLLLNQKNNIKHFEELMPSINSIDKLFVWNGNSQIFFAIVKSIEDSVNVDNDTKIGLVRVILLIEDSAQYYSKYLQILYSIVFGQVLQILPEVEKNELNKICKMRSRPRILLARNYEDAIYIFHKYKDFLLCVISDVEFEREGKLDKTAGASFIKYVKKHLINLPVILQSSEIRNQQVAKKLGVHFINKNSESLLSDLKKFLTYYLGFGDFIFRDKEGNPIAVAKSLREFENLLHDVPAESLYFHAIDNQFSLWLMSRGEIQLAKTLNPIQVTDFDSLEKFRHHFIEALMKYRNEKKRGKILNFDETSIFDEKNIVRFASGSLGGKGRGLAFINSLIYNVDFSDLTNVINIRTPITAIIGTDEFEHFMERNQFFDKIFDSNITYEEIKQHFINAHLSPGLIKKLEVFIAQVHKPIVVRSSSLSEDSITQPFAGVFDTYIIPNNQKNKKVIIEQLANVIKLVYASIYSDSVRIYFKAINHKLEEERMAVVLQELVGDQYENYYYPHISGTAQSYNYYPVAHMKPEEGFAVTAIGLGYYVVGGRKSYRFSPSYPKIEIYTPQDLLHSTQVNFLALDLTRKNIDYVKNGELAPLALLDISEAEKHGTIKHCASVYNSDNDSIETGINTYGPRVINFADILKYDYIPLAQTIDTMLNTIKEALGSPVEIEYAIDLNKTINNLPSFYLLQIKPLVGNQLSDDIDIDKIDKSKTFLYTQTSLGNGKLDYIHDVIFIDPARFDKMKTLEMVKEIEYLNNKMEKQGKKYILIGPGRWGTRDQYLGVPVVWSQISNAKVIVEISLANYPLDSSLGSHFFHNVTSMNIGYFSVLDTSNTDFIKWDILNKQKIVHQTEFFKHIQFPKPLTILMNGKQRISAILY
jgi:CheY-like chemotaxis protein